MVPRVFTPPLVEGPPGDCPCGCALTEETSHGFNAIRFAEDVLKIELYPWQRWLLIHMLELLPTKRYRYRIVVILVARQNGKSLVAQVLALWWIFVRGLGTVLGTAQDLSTAEKTWGEAVDLAESIEELAEHIDKVVQVNGQKALILDRCADGHNREKYLVKAASRKAGRGFTGAGVFMDELREQVNWDAWGAITKTTMAKPNAQIVTASNAGDAASVVLAHLRALGHEAAGDPDGVAAAMRDQVPTLNEVVRLGADWEQDDDEFNPDEDLDDLDEDLDLGLFEWSATPGCNKNDEREWAKANPSMNHSTSGDTGITSKVLRSAARSDPEWVFRTECLCQWPDGRIHSEFDGETWKEIIDPESQIVGPVRACVEISSDRRWTYVAFAGMRADGLGHIEVVARRAGDEWVADWLMDPRRRDRIQAVTGQWNGAPVSPTIRQLKVDSEDPNNPFNLKVVPWEGPEVSAGFARIHDDVRDHKVRRLDQPTLNSSGMNAVTKRAGDGKMWDRSGSPVDIGSLVGVTGAWWLWTQQVTEVPRVSAYEARGLLVV